MKIKSIDVFSVDLPFKNTFKHAAATRKFSESIFVKCVTETGHIGYGETLPRKYVTGESRESTFDLLCHQIAPNLKGMNFHSFHEVIQFLEECDGKAPSHWVNSSQPHTAAWCAVDLALLDAFSRAFNVPISLSGSKSDISNFRYSPVISSDSGFKLFKTLVKIRLFNCKQVKLKIQEDENDFACWLTRKILGRNCDIRVDVNMAWNVNQALVAVHQLSKYGIQSYEQPLPSDNISGLARLVEKSDVDIMVDESLSDKESLDKLIKNKACTALNVRISKCGGLVAAYARCKQGLQAGLKIQIGCLTGESSLLSAANLKLIEAVGEVAYGEGCFGLLLLKEDPFSPVLQFGYGGKPPEISDNIGFGVSANQAILNQWILKHEAFN